MILSMIVEPGEYFLYFSLNGVQFVALRRLRMTYVTGRGTDKIPARGSSKPQNYRSKMIRPKPVTKTGSYFCIINLWFSAQNGHLAGSALQGKD